MGVQVRDKAFCFINTGSKLQENNFNRFKKIWTQGSFMNAKEPLETIFYYGLYPVRCTLLSDIT